MCEVFPSREINVECVIAGALVKAQKTREAIMLKRYIYSLISIFFGDCFRRSILIALSTALVACGGGGSPPSKDQYPLPIGQETSLSKENRSLVLEGVASFYFDESYSASAPKVSATKTSNISSAEIFKNVQNLLGVQSASDYEVELTVSALPNMPTVVTLKIPALFIEKLNNDNAPIAYLEIPEDDEDATYVAIKTTYNIKLKEISAEIPVWGFSSNNGGAYKAIVKIGIAGAHNMESLTKTSNAVSHIASFLPKEGEWHEAGSDMFLLSCPLKKRTDGCIEKSRVGPRVGGSSSYHYGIDFRGNGDPVYAVHSGEVVIVDRSSWGAVIIRSGSQFYRYLHLASIPENIFSGAFVSEGTIVGSASNKHPRRSIDAHLHFEMIHPVNYACSVKEVGSAECTKYVLNYVDSFNFFIKKMKILRNSEESSAKKGDKFYVSLISEDKNGISVASQIDNVKTDKNKIQGKIRKLTWTNSNERDVKVEFSEKTTQSEGLEISSDPLKRNELVATILNESSASFLVKWESLYESQGVEAEYILSTCPYKTLFVKPEYLGGGAYVLNLPGDKDSNGDLIKIYYGTYLIDDIGTRNSGYSKNGSYVTVGSHRGVVIYNAADLTRIVGDSIEMMCFDSDGDIWPFSLIVSL